MKLFNPKIIMIDVDGTMVNSVPDLAYCIDQMMQHLGKDKCGEKKIIKWIGNGIPRLVEMALTDNLGYRPDDSLQQKAQGIFLDFYAQNITGKSVLYDGVIEALDYMKNSGYILSCITNKAHRFTSPLLKSLDIFDYFEIILSGDTLPRKKPDPLSILHIANYFKINPKDCLMIGDSIIDIKTARAAGSNVICVSYGYNKDNDIVDANPDLIIESMRDLSEYI